jgi:hypothetical protein
VPPESVDRYKCPSELEPPPAAIRVLPSAELATVTQFVMGAVVWAQLSPEFVETKIGPLANPLTPLTATSLVPSADVATELYGWKGGLCWLQVFPASVEV